MIIPRRICFFVLFCISTSLCAQEYTNGMLEFRQQITRIVLSADRVPGSTIILRLRTFKTASEKGDKERIVIRFINDSVFEQKNMLDKTQHVIRGNSILDYDPEAGKAIVYSSLERVDSAGYYILAFRTFPDDTVYSSYCRMRYDSLNRMCDYYYVYRGTKPVHETWTYEGDSLTVHNRYEIVQDTFYLKYQEHTVRYVNADSTYFLRRYDRKTWRDSVYVRASGESHVTRLVYDEKGRILRVEINEQFSGTLMRAKPDVYHTMEVEYRVK